MTAKKMYVFSSFFVYWPVYVTSKPNVQPKSYFVIVKSNRILNSRERIICRNALYIVMPSYPSIAPHKTSMLQRTAAKNVIMHSLWSSQWCHDNLFNLFMFSFFSFSNNCPIWIFFFHRINHLMTPYHLHNY